MNLLFISLDTVRADHIGAYGNSEVSTPNIDRLAAEGVRVENCYTSVPITFPAHCSMFTGKYPLTLNVRNNGKYLLGDDETTLAEILKQKGFHNYAVIAAYVLSAKFGIHQGFDLYDDTLDNTKLVNNFTSEIYADAVYDKFQKWFATHKEKRFFAWVHFYDPHLPYTPPEKFITKKDGGLIDHYNGEIALVDHYVGKITEDLRNAGKLDNTMIVVVGDHGEGFGEHNEFGHSIFCYEETLKVPLIFYHPHGLKPLVVKNRVNLIDLMPTILDLYGETVPKGLDGRSVASWLMGKDDYSETPGDRMLYFESVTGKEEFNWAHLSGVISGNYKYISLPEPELYNLDTDPQEKDNLFLKMKKIVREKKKLLDKFVSSHTGDPKNNTRNMSKKDIAHLKSLGYISSAPRKSKAGAMVDPKKGILLDLTLGKLSNRIDNEEYDAVEAELLKILKDTPEMKTQMIYSLLVKIYEKRGEDNKVIETLEEAAKEFPDFINFRISLAISLMAQKLYDEVIQQMEIVITLDPMHTHAYVLRADAYLELNKATLALRDYKKAAQLEPGNVMLNMRCADLLVKNNRKYEAAHIYERMIDKKGVADNEKFLMWYADFNIKLGKKMRTQQIMKRLVDLKPNGNNYFFYAMALAENRKYKDALHTMEMTLKTYSGDLTDKQKEQAKYAIDLWKGKQ